MSLDLIGRPNKTVNGVISEVSAVEAQLPYTFQREDVIVADVLDNGGGFVLLNISGVDVLEFVEGGTIWVTFGVSEYTDGVYTITDVLVSGNLKVTIDLAFTVPDFTVVVNYVSARPNYRVVVALYDIDEVTNLLPGITFRYSPDQAGRFFLDWGQLLTEYMEERRLLSFVFKLRFREQWAGFQGPDEFAPQTQGIYSWARQLKEEGGSNLWEFLLKRRIVFNYDWSTVAGGLQMLGLTIATGDVQNKFYVGQAVHTSTSTDGNPRDQLVTGERFGNLIGDGDRTGVELTSPWIDGGSQYPPGVVTVLGEGENTGLALTHILDTVKGQGLAWKGWNRTTSYIIDTQFEARTGTNALLIEHRFQDINGDDITLEDANFTNDLTPRVWIIGHRTPPANAFFVSLNARDGNVSDDLSTRTRYKYLPECSNPIMLDWLNGYGAPEQHLFSISQNFERKASTGLVFERGITEDIENVEFTKRRAVRSWVQVMTLEADGLSKKQYEVLSELKSSDFIRCYLSKDGAQFVEVIVINDLTDGGETDEGLFTFQVQIEFPTNFDFFKGKLY